MHRLSSHFALWRFTIASLLVVLMFLSAPVALAFVGYGLVSKKYGCLAIAGTVVVAGLVCGILNFIVSARLRCPLCTVQPLIDRRCSKHKSARKLLGSYRLKVALSILHKSCFICPYCGEPTAMQVREHRRR